jgi:hypothetical protein
VNYTLTLVGVLPLAGVEWGAVPIFTRIREGSCSRVLSEYFYLVRLHRRAGQKDIIVSGQAVHPSRAFWRLRGSNDWNLRKIERVAARDVVPRRRNCAAYANALSVVPPVH